MSAPQGEILPNPPTHHHTRHAHRAPSWEHSPDALNWDPLSLGTKAEGQFPPTSPIDPIRNCLARISCVVAVGSTDPVWWLAGGADCDARDGGTHDEDTAVARATLLECEAATALDLLLTKDAETAEKWMVRTIMARLPNSEKGAARAKRVRASVLAALWKRRGELLRPKFLGPRAFVCKAVWLWLCGRSPPLEMCTVEESDSLSKCVQEGKVQLLFRKKKKTEGNYPLTVSSVLRLLIPKISVRMCIVISARIRWRARWVVLPFCSEWCGVSAPAHAPSTHHGLTLKLNLAARGWGHGGAESGSIRSDNAARTPLS